MTLDSGYDHFVRVLVFCCVHRVVLTFTVPPPPLSTAKSAFFPSLSPFFFLFYAVIWPLLFMGGAIETACRGILDIFHSFVFYIFRYHFLGSGTFVRLLFFSIFFVCLFVCLRLCVVSAAFFACHVSCALPLKGNLKEKLSTCIQSYGGICVSACVLYDLENKRRYQFAEFACAVILFFALFSFVEMLLCNAQSFLATLSVEEI